MMQVGAGIGAVEWIRRVEVLPRVVASAFGSLRLGFVLSFVRPFISFSYLLLLYRNILRSFVLIQNV